ncbi:MAG: hypothetical protein L0I29_12150 [Hyphomicrobiales bacterium]|nr:hypothetical protein [Hyphomicrobiales bacterium]
MNRILTLFVCLHWAVVFVALTLLAGLHGGENFTAVLAAIGIQFSVDAMPVPAGLCALLAVGFGIVASLFLWALVTGFLDRRVEENAADEVAPLAFAGAVAVFTLVFLGCAAGAEVIGLYRSMALEIGALLASYLAICAERRMAVAAAVSASNEAGAAARTMALHAAHDSLLARLGGGGKSRGAR